MAPVKPDRNPVITTSVSISGAVGSSNQKGPAFIICGGQDTFSGARCEDHPSASYNGTSGVPVFFGKCLDADHGNWGFEMMMANKTNPHDIVQAMIAWFRYHLMADEEYRSCSMAATVISVATPTGVCSAKVWTESEAELNRDRVGEYGCSGRK